MKGNREDPESPGLAGLGESTASHTQLVKDKNEKSLEQKRLIRIQPNRTKSKACLKFKTSEWFQLSWNIDLVKVMASTTSF